MVSAAVFSKRQGVSKPAKGGGTAAMISVDALWQAGRIIMACALCYGASILIGLQEGYWALVTAVVVTQPALDRTLSAGRDRVVGTLIGAFAGLAVILVSQHGISSR